MIATSSVRSSRRRLVSCTVVCGVVVAATAGCTHVRPYERARLAHPTMRSEGLAGRGETHLRAVREGATGGAVGSVSSCGCN